MAKFSQKDIFFKDDDMAVFGTDQDSTLFWDGANDELRLTTTISGVDPTEDYHLTTRWYVDSSVSGTTFISLPDTPNSYDDGKYLISTASGTEWSTVSGGGEVNTASNIGGGEGLYAQKSALDLQFKSLIGAGGVDISSDATTVTISGAACSSGTVTLEFWQAVWAEENGALGNNTYEWAFGNGANTANGLGIAIHVPDGWTCAAAAMGLSIGAGTATVELVINTTVQGSNANVSVFTGTNNVNTFPDVLISNGDVLNFRTTSSTGTSASCQAVVWLKYTKEVTIPTGLQGETGEQGPQGDPGSTTLSGLLDTPDGYDNGKYLQSTVSGAVWTTVSGVSDHGELIGLSDDDHLQYVPRTGSRGFLGTVSGVDPTQDYHLTTKWYVDYQFDRLVSSGVYNAYFDAYDGTGGTDVSSGWTDIPLDVERIKTADFTHSSVSSASEVIINSTGTYIVIARVSTYQSAGDSRSEVGMRLMLDSGSGYTSVSGTTGRLYSRSTSQGASTATVALLLELEQTNGLRIQARRESGSGTILTLAEGSSLTIFPAVGVKGDKGEKGDAGAGSSLIVQDNGVTISGSPTEVLNFKACEIDDTVSGTATILPKFGSWYAYIIEDGQTDTTSTSWIQKSRLSVNGIHTGYYRIAWYYEWGYSVTTRDFQAQVQVDDTTTAMSHREEPKDSGADQWRPSSGFYYVYLTEGNHYVDLDFRASNGSDTSHIRRVRLEFWRLA